MACQTKSALRYDAAEESLGISTDDVKTLFSLIDAGLQLCNVCLVHCLSRYEDTRGMR